MSKISNLQIREGSTFGGLVTENNLAYLGQSKPQQVSNIISQLYTNYHGMDLDTYLDQFPTKFLKDDNEFQWKLQGASEKNVPLIEARISATTAASATDKLGVGVSRFWLVFPEQYFYDTELIVGEKNEVYPIHIKSDPISEGLNWVYECELLTGDATLFIPFEEVQNGKRFSKEWSPVSRTNSNKGGGMNYVSPMTMQNSFTYMRLEDTRPGNMTDKPLSFDFMGTDGKTHTTWMQYADFEFEARFRQMKNRYYMFATPNKTDQNTYLNKSEAGFTIEQGAGIRAQMNPSNVEYFNKLDIDWLTDILLGLSINKLPMDKRKFVLRTGEYGMVAFSRALENKAYGYVRIVNGAPVTSVTDMNRITISGNSMTLKGQFLEYVGPNGIEISIIHEPLYDDTVRNKVKHPLGGPAESYRYDILDVGTTNGDANICKVAQQGMNDITGYIPGLRDPFQLGGKAPKIMAIPTDAYQLHKMAICGVMIKNPTSCLQLIPSILQ
jgi:hypothetical protein